MARNYLKQVQKEFSHIKTHDEDDLEWYNEGLVLLENKKYPEAETKFKMLVVSQPQHPDGYEGLAWVYAKMKRFKEAKYFIDLAVDTVKKSMRTSYSNREALDILLDQKEKIERLAKR